MFKFKKGDLVTEIEPYYFTKGAILEVQEEDDVPYCTLFSGEDKNLDSNYHYQETGQIAIIADELELVK